MNLNSGTFEGWFWLETSSSELDISKLINQCPQCIQNLHIAIKCFDSGQLSWSPEEEQLGFSYANGIPITSKIQDLTVLPIGGFDEWYLFEQLDELKIEKDFINYYGFSLVNTELRKHIIAEFWNQLNLISPSKYIAQNGKFIFVTKSADELEMVINACQHTR